MPLSRVAAACDHLHSEYGLATVRGPRTGSSEVARAEAMGRAAATWLVGHVAPGAGTTPPQKTRALAARAG